MAAGAQPVLGGGGGAVCLLSAPCGRRTRGRTGEGAGAGAEAGRDRACKGEEGRVRVWQGGEGQGEGGAGCGEARRGEVRRGKGGEDAESLAGMG